MCLSEFTKCSFFRKFCVLCFLVTPVLRFALLLHYRQTFILMKHQRNESVKLRKVVLIPRYIFVSYYFQATVSLVLVTCLLLFYYRNSRPKVFFGKGVLKIYSKFTGEHPCRSAIAIKLQSKFIEIALWHGCSHVNLLYIFRTPYSKNTSGRLFLQLDFQNFEKLRCISVNHGQNLVVMKNSYCYFLDVIFASMMLKHCFEMISVSKFPKTYCKTQPLKQIKKHLRNSLVTKKANVLYHSSVKIDFFLTLTFLRLFYIQNFLFSWILLHLYPKLIKLKCLLLCLIFLNIENLKIGNHDWNQLSFKNIRKRGNISFWGSEILLKFWLHSKSCGSQSCFYKKLVNILIIQCYNYFDFGKKQFSQVYFKFRKIIEKPTVFNLKFSKKKIFSWVFSGYFGVIFQYRSRRLVLTKGKRT